MILWILLCAHCLGDFTLQSADWAAKKTQKFRYLLGHAAVYGAVMALALFVAIPAETAALPLAILASSHFVIDWLRVWLDQKWVTPGAHFRSFLLDQLLHVLIICGTVYAFQLHAEIRAWLSGLPVEAMTRHGLIFLAILDPASVFVKKLSLYVSGQPSSGKKEPPVGSVIGKLERLLIAIFVLCNQLGAIGFVLTAKSLARYKQLSERDFAEKYLVGTLSSTAFAVIVALLLK